MVNGIPSLATHEFEREIKLIKVEKMKSDESRLQLKYSLREAVLTNPSGGFRACRSNGKISYRISKS